MATSEYMVEVDESGAGEWWVVRAPTGGWTGDTAAAWAKRRSGRMFGIGTKVRIMTRRGPSASWRMHKSFTVIGVGIAKAAP